MFSVQLFQISSVPPPPSSLQSDSAKLESQGEEMLLGEVGGKELRRNHLSKGRASLEVSGILVQGFSG